MLASLAYHDYEGVALRDDEKPRLQADLGQCDFLMLRNHGLLTVGRSIADGFLAMHTFENACRIQVDAQAGTGGLVTVNPAIVQGMQELARSTAVGQRSATVWPALLRQLDRTAPDYKT